ncbi:MAG: dTMP kinase [Candidatus Methanoplasma sp.]|jgi:dTMP kinase|nr:dTMP kinase [Candidatus Methanoplasma sp.]
MTGIFIVLEGIDGSGKSTMCSLVAEALGSLGRRAVATCEPTGGPVGSLIRAGAAGASPAAEALLFAADRAIHSREIRGLLDGGSDVVCDRYVASSVAYQSSAPGEGAPDAGWIMEINRPGAIAPDATFLLDLDPEVGMGRIGARGERSRFEDAEYLRRVRAAYLGMAAEDPSVAVLDASRPKRELLGEIMERIRGII